MLIFALSVLLPIGRNPSLADNLLQHSAHTLAVGGRQLIALVEGARSVKWLESAGVVSYETRPMATDALRWAAYTYVIAAIGSLATLLYYISLGSRRN